MIEICAGSYEDALIAAKAGIGRIELNCALALGGLTPSVSTLKKIKEETSLEVICMVRPREGGFCYSDSEYTQMYEEAKALLESGADGLAFGFLKSDASIDAKRTKAFVSLIHSYGKTAVFHRAFDVSDDLDDSIKTLIDLGVDRTLTSGGASTASKGCKKLYDLVIHYNSQIEILAGSGINAANVKKLMEDTGVTQVHASCRGNCVDFTGINHDVSFGDTYQKADINKIRELIQAV